MKICNNCPQLSLTEEEQNRLHLFKIEKPHMCRKYNQRVFHKTDKLNHDSTIYPCSECVRDNKYKINKPDAKKTQKDKTRYFITDSNDKRVEGLEPFKFDIEPIDKHDRRAVYLGDLKVATINMEWLYPSWVSYSEYWDSLFDIMSSRNIYTQVRKHKRKRINKKRAKRYGYKLISQVCIRL